MDFMPHREDEMVIDEDTFLNSSSNASIDPVLLAQSQPQSLASSSLSNASHFAPPTQDFPLAAFYEYRHVGCLCKVKPETFPNSPMQLWEPPESSRSFLSQACSQDQTIPAKLWIIHSLHCKMCSWAESQRIYYTAKARCEAISAKPISEEIKNRMIAYEEGVRDGRIMALDLSLDWSEIYGSRKGGKVTREMANLMERLNVKSDEAIEEELVAGIQGMEVEYDVLEYDLMREIELGELRENGIADGVGVQGRKEGRRLAKRKF
ncbi:hypothetical protein ONS95_007349 [Cadophora gregata]|uniref:uncharacterized protein n=1 Tax=Cadophora gregata TaxID=51156 RepID=UPI0026DAB81A|nr:uncharacterized protein ONS95_007349 [Cadophora gregata]KAK0100905.1 hypothetical protein ONS95_007349 [Cadophora gregata]KAK0117101.1 hypothetical protein ONS96_012937 [Cadophora gregata f. sp. sojae]